VVANPHPKYEGLEAALRQFVAEMRYRPSVRIGLDVGDYTDFHPQDPRYVLGNLHDVRIDLEREMAHPGDSLELEEPGGERFQRSFAKHFPGANGYIYISCFVHLANGKEVAKFIEGPRPHGPTLDIYSMRRVKHRWIVTAEN